MYILPYRFFFAHFFSAIGLWAQIWNQGKLSSQTNILPDIFDITPGQIIFEFLDN